MASLASSVELKSVQYCTEQTQLLELPPAHAAAIRTLSIALEKCVEAHALVNREQMTLVVL
jgi:hypothetical protein